MVSAGTASVPCGIDQLTAHWLTDVLRTAGVIDCVVQRVQSRPLDVASAVGSLARLSLTYESQRAQGPGQERGRRLGRTLGG